MGFFSMTLFKHPKTGGWYFRRVVPERLRKAIGKREIRESLATKDPHEAKRKYPEVAARIQALLSSAAAPSSLDNQQVVALSRGWYRAKLLHDQREPGEEHGLGQLLDDLKAISAPKKRRAAVAEFVEEILSAATIVVDEPSRARLSDQVFEDYKRLLWVLIKRAEGDYTPDTFAENVPEFQKHAAKAAPSVSLKGLVEAWKGERKPPEKTAYEWSRKMDRFADFIGHDDAAKIKKTDIVRWKDHLIAKGKSTKTVQNHLAIAHTIFQLAADNEKIASNPVAGVRVASKKTAKRSRLPYTDEDAKVILKAARKETGAKRWTPWLLAYTGARLDEVCQCLASDIKKEDSVWIVDLHADDPGKSLKTVSSVRKVPLHPALIAEGFLDYVRSLPSSGPLFPDLTPDRFGRRGGNGTKLIGRWVRSLGITDKRKAPNHSWRHRFKDACRAAGIAKDVHDALTGHAAGDEGSSYGLGFAVKKLHKEVSRIPTIKVQ